MFYSTSDDIRAASTLRSTEISCLGYRPVYLYEDNGKRSNTVGLRKLQ